MMVANADGQSFPRPLKTSSQNPETKTQKTKVIAAVYGPRVPPGRPSGTAASSAAEIRVELSIAEFAAAAGGGGGGKRRGGGASGGDSAEQRAVGSGGRDRRASEAAQALRDALEATVLASLHPRSRLDVCVSVLAADGGWLAAAVNAASAALADAGVPCADLLAAATATSLPGCGEHGPLLDPSHAEESGDGVLVTVGLHSGAASRAATVEGGEAIASSSSSSNFSSDGQIAMLFSERRCPLETLEKTAEAAARGAAAAAAVIRSALLDASAVAVAARGGGG